MKNNLSENVNSLFISQSLDLEFVEEQEKKQSYIKDEFGNRIYTFPILESEECFLKVDDSECVVRLSIITYGRSSKTIMMKSTEVFNSQSFIKKFGYKPFADFDKNSWIVFFDMLRAMLLETEQKMVYTYSGWNKTLEECLYGSLLITDCDVKKIDSALFKNETKLSRLSEREICLRINKIFKNLTRYQIVGYIMLLYLMLSCVIQRVIQKYQKRAEFLLAIIAGTGSGKTSVSDATFNTIDGPRASFEDTLAAVCRQFQNNRIGITIVDDEKKNNSKNKQICEKIVRLSGDAKTLGKRVEGNKISDELITGMAVLTGEQRPHLQQSSYSRILFLDLDSSPINWDILTQLQESKAEVNSFMILFIKYVIWAGDFDEVLVEKVTAYRETFRKEEAYKGMHGRYYGIYAWMRAIWENYVDLMKYYDCELSYDFDTEIKNFIYRQHCFYNDDPILLFSKAYKELIDSNELVVIENVVNDDLNFDVIDYNDLLFVKSGSTYKKICLYWQQKGVDFPCSERKLRSLLVNADLLDLSRCKKNNTTVERKTKNNRSYSGFILNKNLFLNYGGNSK